MKKNNRVYGVVGIRAKMSMWNADMNLEPKRTAEDIIYGSDKALKYSIKNLWRLQGEQVLYAKHRNNEHVLMNLRDIYEKEFGEKLPADKGKGAVTVLNNILKCPDVRQFGCTFAVDKQNIGITGVVQVGQGMNKWENTDVEIIDIMSPFVNPKGEKATMTSLGKKVVVNEAHYFYPISINPENYTYLCDIVDGFEGYTEEDYEKLKSSLLVCATALDTNSKAGCENEFALFINCKEGSDLYLANLDSYISMDEEHKVDITKLQELLQHCDKDIESIEIFYNPLILSLKSYAHEKIIIKNMYNEKI